ncbi:MAG: FtsX-like permease family protein [Chloroflexi bacterium]|nr:FtsX-like permease family protein [Chloroflexota bacterium]
MENIFGIPMGSLAVALAVVLGILMAPVIFTMLFKRVMFRIGIRNIPRRRAQTLLIVVGLMLSTLSISSAFGFGDSLNYSVKKGVYDQLGPIDETVEIKGVGGVGGPLGMTPFSEAIYGQVASRLAGNASIDGYIPSLLSQAAISLVVAGHPDTGVRTEPGARIMGVPVDQAFQEVRAQNGATLAGLKAGEVLINEKLAMSLNLKTGDSMQVYAGPRPVQFTVAGILANGGLAGTVPQVTASLLVVQAAAGLEGQITSILISNSGSVEEGEAGTEAAMTALTAATVGTPVAPVPAKQNGIKQAESIANIFTTVFLVFGLFSVMVGVLLIFLIFMMLAAERRAEMGISRAIGTKRRHLIQSFLAEGAAYSILAGAVGSGFGVLVSWVLISWMGNLLAGVSGSSFGFDIKPRSLIVAYCLGMIITFLTVVFSSWRVSRLNIVAAIRDLPDLKVRRPRSRSTVVLGLVFVGAITLAVTGWLNINALSFWIGTSMAIISAGLLGRRFGVPERLAYSASGVSLITVCLGSFYLDRYIKRLAELGGGIEMFFLFGMILVAGAVWVAMYNAGSVITGIAALFRRSKTLAPVLKTAFAYPLAYPFRTGLTTAMFALVVFSLVIMAVVSSSFTKDAAGINQWAGGYMVQATTNPNNAPNAQSIEAALSTDPELRDTVTGVGMVAFAPAEGQQQGLSKMKEYGAVVLNGGDPYFMANSQYKLKVRAAGYADDRAIWDAMAKDPSLAVATADTVQTGEAFAGSFPFMIEGLKPDDKSMQPMSVMLRSPADGKSAAYKVIGVLDANNMVASAALYTSMAGLERVTGHTVAPSQYYFKLASGADEVAAAQGVETAFASNAMQAKSQTQAYNELNATILGFMTLIQVYMGLGLLVGIAALGVIAIRSVVERRQQIGVLRAIGFKRRMVQLGFMIESSFIAMMGIAIGVVLGVVLAYLMTHDPAFSGGTAEFSLPWLRLGVIVLAAYVAAVLMTYLPARQAGRVPVAEALRSE